MKLCYTAIFGKYDKLKKPAYITPGWEYWCYTDHIFTPVAPWKIILVSTSCGVEKKYARYVKILCPSKFSSVKPSQSIWFDASIEIKGNLDELVKPAEGFDGMVLKHPHRSTLQEEAQAILRRKKDSMANVNRQLIRYQNEKYVQSTPLVATGILYREHNESTKQFSQAWWNEVNTGSHRDQLSFNYALQKSQARFLVSSMNIYDKNNPYFLLHKHL